MNRHVFQCCSKTTDPETFSVTVKNLTHYTSKIFKSTADLDPIFKRFTTPHINKLVKPELKDAVDIAIFNEDIKKISGGGAPSPITYKKSTPSSGGSVSIQ